LPKLLQKYRTPSLLSLQNFNRPAKQREGRGSAAAAGAGLGAGSPSLAPSLGGRARQPVGSAQSRSCAGIWRNKVLLSVLSAAFPTPKPVAQERLYWP